MSWRKSPTRSPALLAANRANAQNSTAPRTARGKAQITLNPALRDGGYGGEASPGPTWCEPGRMWLCTTGCTVKYVTTSARWEQPGGWRPNGWRGRPCVVAGGFGRRVCGRAEGLPPAVWCGACAFRPSLEGLEQSRYMPCNQWIGELRSHPERGL